MLGLLIIAVALGGTVYAAWPRPLTITALAVGDGDCLLVRTPAGRTLLIDGGSRSQYDVGEQVIVPNLCLLGVKRLDAVIITHADSDHVNGLPAVLRAVPVGMLIHPDMPEAVGAYQHLLATAQEAKIPCRVARRGARLRLDDDVTFEILHPRAALLENTVSDENANSLVGMLQYRKTRMLCTGDLTLEGEQALLATRDHLQADVLKVAHHGSRGSTSDAWLERVHPRYALISGQGTDGRPGTTAEHPHPELLARLRRHHVTMYRTDMQGCVTLRTDGRQWRMHSVQ